MGEIEHFKQRIDGRYYRFWEMCGIILMGIFGFLSFVITDAIIEKTYAVIVGLLIWILLSVISLRLLKTAVSKREYGIDDKRLYFSQTFIRDEPIMELKNIEKIILPKKGRFFDLYILPYSAPNIILYSAKNHQAALGVDDLDSFILALKKRLPNVPITTETAE